MKSSRPLSEKDLEALYAPEMSGAHGFEEVTQRKRPRHSAGASGAIILLSNNLTTDAAPNGAIIGTFAVQGGTGVFTFSFLSNPGALFALVGPLLEVNAAPLSVGSDIIGIKADNGAGIVLLQSFIIVVSHGGYVPTYELLGF